MNGFGVFVILPIDLPKLAWNLPEIETITVQIQINPLKLVRFSKFEESIKSPVIVLKDWSNIRIGVL